MMYGTYRVNGIYSVPRIWHGPAAELPESIKQNGIDPRSINLDPSTLVTFQRFPIRATTESAE